MKKYLTVCMACIVISSSSKDVLKEEPKVPTGTQLYKNASDLSLASTGLYALINVAFNQMAGFTTCYRG